MVTAALRLFALLLALHASFDARGAEPAARVNPSRPGSVSAPAATGASPSGAIPTTKIGGVEYVSVADVATRLSLRLATFERGRRVTLTGPSGRAELENDSRDITVNGLRVFLGDPVLDAGRQLYVSRIDFERCLTPMLRPGFGVPQRRELKTVVLDPGHGGRDNGTSVNEKTYALDVARRARRLLEASGYRVILTRDSDVFLELGQRAEIANTNRADLFVSIHFNAVPNDSRTSGVEVFTFAPRAQHSAEWWSLKRKDDPHLELTEMPVNRFDHWSVILAHTIHRRFVTDLKAYDRGKKIAHWGVLRSLECPGVLIECGFLTSSAEAKKIATSDYRQKLAVAVANGIRDYATLVDPPRGKSAASSARGPRPVKAAN
ncbi:N-acetylmuramoyl-L-alanine amidase family protein [Horticoccus sp. 23ND18S-11]|uniref:N-acetylmuramoyl-L-alanine amidase family protein n=1 Tax=Horticoccus sp. 23ND18S-11 TaxID=3391832 RepID=UPI0039C9043A